MSSPCAKNESLHAERRWAVAAALPQPRACRREAEPDARHVASRERTARASAARHRCVRRDAQARVVRTALLQAAVWLWCQRCIGILWRRVDALVDQRTPRDLLLSITRDPRADGVHACPCSCVFCILCSRPTVSLCPRALFAMHFSGEMSKKGPKIFRLRRAEGALRAVQKRGHAPTLDHRVCGSSLF